jgi:hypothetical protein
MSQEALCEGERPLNGQEILHVAMGWNKPIKPKGGVSRREVEKTCGRNVSGAVGSLARVDTPGDVAKRSRTSWQYVRRGNAAGQLSDEVTLKTNHTRGRMNHRCVSAGGDGPTGSRSRHGNRSRSVPG